MATTYTERIKSYCEAQGVEVPVGFGRHPASQYAIVQTHCTPPRLVARTWFKQADVVYYLNHLDQGRTCRILDFKDQQELHHDGGSTLRRGRPFKLA